MHDAALDWLTRTLATLPPRRRVLEMGSRDVNGTARPLFKRCRYLGIDLMNGPGVDRVANAATFDTSERFDTILCTEVFEHTPDAERICKNAHRLLRPGGVFLVTAAGEGREPHSGFDGEAPDEGEYYENVTEEMLRGWLAGAGFCGIIVTTESPGDIYALAHKPEQK